MEQLLLFLYPAAAIIAGSAYLPQIRALWVSKTASKNMSIQSWLLWTVANLITWGYASVVVEDLLLSLAAFFNFSMCLTISVLIINNRYVRYGECRNLFEGFIHYLLIDCLHLNKKLPEPIPVKDNINKR